MIIFNPYTMKTITLPENESKASRILIAASKMKLDEFVKYQERECKDVGAVMEMRIMRVVAKHLDIEVRRVDFSKYKNLLTRMWSTARGFNVIVEKSDLDLHQNEDAFNHIIDSFKKDAN